MIRSLPSMIPVLFSVAALLSLTACGGLTPAEEIELELEEYRAMVLELNEVMEQLKNKEISADEAQQKLGNHFVQEMAAKEAEVRATVEEHRDAIGDDKAVAFLSTLEGYRQLGRVGGKPDKAEMKRMD